MTDFRFNFTALSKLLSFKLKSQTTRFGVLLVCALSLASCANLNNLHKTKTPVVPYVPGTQNITFAQNQEALKNITALDLGGQIGVYQPGSRYSAGFFLNDNPNGDYRITLDVPYTSDQVSLIKLFDNYYYVDENGQAYTADTMAKFSEALFGFKVPLNILKDIILGQVVYSFDNFSDPTKGLVVENNVIKSQVYNTNTFINYSDYRFVDNKVIVPMLINISYKQYRLKILFHEPYKFYTAQQIPVSLTKGLQRNKVEQLSQNSTALIENLGAKNSKTRVNSVHTISAAQTLKNKLKNKDADKPNVNVKAKLDDNLPSNLENPFGKNHKTNKPNQPSQPKTSQPTHSTPNKTPAPSNHKSPSTGGGILTPLPPPAE